MKNFPYKYAAALTASLGLFMAVLDNTIVNVALTPMATAFKTNINSVQWVITAYFLAQAAVIPTAGYMANRFGIKRVFMICLAFFTIGSLLCGLSDLLKDSSDNPQIVWLIVFRVLQGIGGGALFPLATAIAFGVFPPAERAAGSAIVGIPVLLAPAFGPTIGGWIVDSLGWNWIFFVNVPIGAVTLVLIWRILKPDPKADPTVVHPKFDIPGLVLSMIGIITIVYAFTLVGETNPDTVTATNPNGDIYGWGYWLVWTLMGVGVVIVAAFSVYELKIAKDPVLDLRLFKKYEFAMANIMTWTVRGVVFGSFFLLPVFLENIRYPNLSAVDTGLALMPQGLAAAVAIALGGRLYNIIGPRWLVFIGMIALTISTFMLTGLTNESDGWSFVPVLLIRGFGFGWGAFPVQTLALSSITGPALPKASSLFNATAQVFSSIGVAVLSTVFVTQTIANVPTPTIIQGYAVNAALLQPAGADFSKTYLTTHNGMTLEDAKKQPDFAGGVLHAVLDPNKAAAYTQKFIADHPGTKPTDLQSASAPQAYTSGLLQAAAPQAVIAETQGRAVAYAGVPALNAVFTIVMYGTGVLILVALLLPNPRQKKKATAEAGSEEHHHVMVEA
jgi:EmrB/QacA subfamily drug resistance transporter